MGARGHASRPSDYRTGEANLLKHLPLIFLEIKMQNTKSTYLILKLEIKKEADIDDIIRDLKDRDYEPNSGVFHKDVMTAEIVGSSDGLIFD
mgnify:FL=1